MGDLRAELSKRENVCLDVTSPDDFLARCQGLTRKAGAVPCRHVTLGGHGAGAAGLMAWEEPQKGAEAVGTPVFGCSSREGYPFFKQTAELLKCFRKIIGPSGVIKLCSCGCPRKATPEKLAEWYKDFDECLTKLARESKMKVCGCFGPATSGSDGEYCSCDGRWVCRG